MKFEDTPLYKSLSDLGKRIFLPNGIFYWSGRAKKEAELIGTVGSAFGYEKDFIDGGRDEWMPCYIEAVKNYSKLDVKDLVPYASIGGLADLRQLWKDWIVKKSLYNEEVNKEKIEHLKSHISKPLVTNGLTNGIYVCTSMLLNPGESIISPNKRWGNYDNIIKKNVGAKIESFEYFEGQKFNLRGLEETIKKVAKNQEKIVIILNFPNNPTGYVPTKEEAEQIVGLLKKVQNEIKKPIVVIVDDAYEPYLYSDEVMDHSIFYDLHELEEDVIPIKLDGISKELLAYGGRIGFITIGLKSKWAENEEELNKIKEEVNNKLEGFNRSTISNANHFYQALTFNLFKEKGMDGVIAMREGVRKMLQKRYESINAEFGKLDDDSVSVDPNAGGFFLFVNLDPGKIKAADFADHLLTKYKVGIVPIEKEAEGVNGIRIAYCSIDLPDIPEIVNRIITALNDY